MVHLTSPLPTLALGLIAALLAANMGAQTTALGCLGLAALALGKHWRASLAGNKIEGGP